jgi:hypothetical protein
LHPPTPRPPANTGNMQIISRDEALRLGLKVFYTGKPCYRGHDSGRYVAESRCIVCNSINSKKHRERNKEAINAQRAEFCRQNRERVLAQKKEDYRKHKAKRRATSRAWHEANRDKVLSYLRDWQAANADQFKASKNAYYRNRKQSDPAFAMLARLRRRINNLVSGSDKSCTTAELIGCSHDAFARHIESLFTDGMTWENRRDWHIDHIIPCAAFDMNDPQQQRQCFHYSNMRPLWAYENQRKGASMPVAA